MTEEMITSPNLFSIKAFKMKHIFQAQFDVFNAKIGNELVYLASLIFHVGSS